MSNELVFLHPFSPCRIYAKLLEHFRLDEFGTNFAKDVYDPHAFAPEEHYDKLGAFGQWRDVLRLHSLAAEKQRALMNRSDKKKQEREEQGKAKEEREKRG